MKNPNLYLVDGKTEKKLGDLPDDDLMILARAERKDAFEALVRRHQTLVLALATRFLGDKALGRDVTQEVFLSLWAERYRYRPRGHFRSYLVSVTHHRCHYVARQRRSHGRKLGNLARNMAVGQPEPELPLETLVAAEKAREVRRKLEKLPERIRQVLILRFTQDCSLQEIAELTGLPLGTVKSHLFRGLKRLNRLIGKEAS
jgi:RNA polymerase sigma-70 factor (ECF subfamily)